MPFHSHFTTISIFPHVFSWLESTTKKVYKEKYKKIKKYGSISMMTGVGVAEGTQLVKDIINSKLKVYSYKSLFAITIGPVIQFIYLPLYIFSYGSQLSKLRHIAFATTEIGAKISKGEMGIVNWAWIGADLLFFGEPISITDDSDFLIIHNETTGKLSEIINDLKNED